MLKSADGCVCFNLWQERLHSFESEIISHLIFQLRTPAEIIYGIIWEFFPKWRTPLPPSKSRSREKGARSACCHATLVGPGFLLAAHGGNSWEDTRSVWISLCGWQRDTIKKKYPHVGLCTERGVWHIFSVKHQLAVETICFCQCLNYMSPSSLSDQWEVWSVRIQITKCIEIAMDCFQNLIIPMLFIWSFFTHPDSIAVSVFLSDSGIWGMIYG